MKTKTTTTAAGPTGQDEPNGFDVWNELVQKLCAIRAGIQLVSTHDDRLGSFDNAGFSILMRPHVAELERIIERLELPMRELHIPGVTK